MNNENTKQITQEEVKKLKEAYQNKKERRLKNMEIVKNNVRMYFWKIANKRYMQNKKNKLIDNILFFIVNTLNK